MAQDVNVGIIGYNFMGRAHSNAYRQAPFYFPELDAVPVRKVMCGRTEDKLKQFADQFGWKETETDFEKLVERDDLDLIDITAPNNWHKDMIVAAAEAGKDVFCEKPLATTLDDAVEALHAVEDAGVRHMICHNYRRAPACMLAKKMIENGDLGEIYHWRSVYLQDFIIDPEFPMMWRLDKDVAGSGALGDLMAHSIDMALWLIGDITEVASNLTTFIKQRPLAEAADTGLGGAAAEGAEMGKVDVDDATIALARFDNGAIGTMEATRFASGRKNHNKFEINGSKGSIVFNLEKMNELQYYNADDPEDRLGFRTIQATADCHPMMEHPSGGPRYWPVAHIIGYEHTFINTVAALMKAIAADEMPWPNFRDGCRTQAVLHACQQADKSRKWEEVPQID